MSNTSTPEAAEHKRYKDFLRASGLVVQSLLVTRIAYI
jgi:hypothetical protein